MVAFSNQKSWLPNVDDIIAEALERTDRAPVFTIATVSATLTTPGSITVPYNQIRVVKTGTAGVARAVLYG